MFSGKYIFSGNVNFRKRKIFPCVWLHFKKFFGKYFLVFGKEEGKHKSRKTQATTQKKLKHSSNSSSRISRRHDLAKARSRSTVRSHRLKIAINGAILRRRDRDRRIFLSDLAIFLDGSSSRISRRRDLVKARSRSTARSRDGEIATNGVISRWRDRVRRFSSRARARSLSLSLSHFPKML